MEVTEDVDRADIVELAEMDEVGDKAKKWVVVEAIGSGAYGDVYHVWNKEDGRQGAMKIEALQAKERILKNELAVLNAYKREGEATMQLLGFGITPTFTYIVMTLCGADLAALNQRVVKFNESTVLRVALRSLISLKELHDVGYIHRDIKPSNFASSTDDSKNVYLIDFGMTRLYAFREKEERSWLLKDKRNHVAFRGTIRYCSIGMHERQDQGRVDDLWGWLYMCVEMGRPLPWRKYTHPEKVHHEKKTTTTEKLLGHEPLLQEWKPIVDHLQQLGFYDRPAYEMIVDVLRKQICERGILLLANYHWEEKKDTEVEEQTTAAKLKAVVEKYGRPMPKKEKMAEMAETKLWEAILTAAKKEKVPGGEGYRSTKVESDELTGRSRSRIMPSSNYKQKKKALEANKKGD